MKEQLITFETAKLAKEKGFNIKTEVFFRPIKKQKVLFLKWTEYDNSKPILQRPTQSLLQKWLREKYGLCIEIRHWVNKSQDFLKCTFVILKIGEGSVTPETYFNTISIYEEALEKGLQEALKLI